MSFGSNRGSPVTAASASWSARRTSGNVLRVTPTFAFFASSLRAGMTVSRSRPNGWRSSRWIEAAEGTPVEWAFCANVVRSHEPYVVPDATVDALQHDNPLVTQDGIRCYAGVPITTPNGHVLGAYCVVGEEPHDFTAADVAELQEMAKDVVTVLEQHRID